MVDRRERRILAANESADFVGRSSELKTLSELARGDGPVIVAGPPGAGVSELLKQTFDHLFQTQNAIIPFYFALSFSCDSAEAEARRLLHRFLLQSVAFRRREPVIINWFPDLSELAQLALPADRHWVDRLIGGAASLGEGQISLSSCLAAPLRAAAAGAPSFVIIDDCHAAAYSDATGQVYHLLVNALENSGLPCILAGRRRFDFRIAANKRINIDRLELDNASRAVENQADHFGVRITDETRDLIANQFAGNCTYVRQIFLAAAERNADLDSFLGVQKLYAQEIFGGRIKRRLDGTIDRLAQPREMQPALLSFLDEGSRSSPRQLSLESWLKSTALAGTAFDRLVEKLNIEEFVSLNGQRIDSVTTEPVIRDYVLVRVRLEVSGEPRAAVFGQSVASFLKRSPRMMAEWYRRRAAVGIRDLLAQFSLQHVPLAALDYNVFADHYKGLPDQEVMTGLRADEASVRLPQIVYTANADDLYGPIGELTDSDRSAIALGFQEGKYSDEDEIVWIVAEIDSKLEASEDLTEFWCDRLEMVALMCEFDRFQLWLIAPEGFEAAAAEVLRRRGAFGSSRRQVGFLKVLVSMEEPETPGPADEYEVVVPMDDESELIAAYALEEIARRHNVAPKAINQLKTALIEASINASEHSLSPDRKIRQKVRVEDDKIVVTISNRGLRLADRVKLETEGVPGVSTTRRGWGLKLIEKLMDKVEVHQTDDGTSISMTKYLNADAAA